mmetsp:Transcript_114303/g.334201  ORF Transcript_114303/g.334201 Transcript_114303/m.334201 type:complete len:86 (-) Transcript_114303:154-411(-)
MRSYSNPKDTVHVVIGSAGDDEGLTDTWQSAPAWSAVRDGRHVGYAEIQFENATTLTFTYRAADSGTVLDNFVLQKDRGLQEVVV